MIIIVDHFQDSCEKWLNFTHFHLLEFVSRSRTHNNFKRVKITHILFNLRHLQMLMFKHTFNSQLILAI